MHHRVPVQHQKFAWLQHRGKLAQAKAAKYDPTATRRATGEAEEQVPRVSVNPAVGPAQGFPADM